MSLPEVLWLELEKISSDFNKKILVSDAQKISQKYRDNKGADVKMLSSKNQAIAYSVSRMPATYAACYSVLKHTQELISNEPFSMLDVGAGTGAASWAALDLLNLKKLDCFEREQSMIEVAKRLMKNLNTPTKINWQSFDLRKDAILDKYDIVFAAYVLNEFTDKERIEILEKLWKATNDLLTIVEPGTPHNFQQVKEMRQHLLNKGGCIVAPCSHCKDCAIEDGDWCNFSCRIERSKMQKMAKNGEAPYEDEKFAYIVVSKKQDIRAKARIIRHPIYTPKVVTLQLCTENGIKKEIITKSNKLYKIARKASHGDVFTYNEE